MAATGPARTIDQAGEQRSARIESLRALAALGVLVGHAWATGHQYRPDTVDDLAGQALFGGRQGVWLFFALSGYLLFWPFARRDLAGGPGVRLRDYAFNRVLRIVPLYVISVVVVLLVVVDDPTRDQWLTHLTLTQTFDPKLVDSVNPVLWTVVVEMHFYALLPLLAAGIGWVARGSAARAALAIAALGAASLAARLATQTFADEPDRLWRYNLPATFFFFTAGMLVAVARTRDLRLPGRADAWILASLPVWFVAALDPDLVPLCAVAAAMVVGAVVLGREPGAVVRLLDIRVLAVVGVASYSLYVWHVPLLEELYARDVLRSPVGLMTLGGLAAVAIALVSYRVFEEPFLRLRRRWASGILPRT